MNKSGIDNLKEQVLSFVSLNKKITRLEFLIYGGVAFALFISLSYLLIFEGGRLEDCITPGVGCFESYRREDRIILTLIMLLILLSASYFTILSIQRLNDLKLSKWLSIIVVLGVLSSLISMYYHEIYYGIRDFVSIPLVFLLIIIFAIFAVFLLLFRGVQSE